MKIKIWEFSKTRDTIDFSYLENLNHLTKEIDQIIEISPVKVEGKAVKVSDVYTVKGRVKTNMVFKCSRCLTDFDYNLENDFEEIFVTKAIEVNQDEEDEELKRLESEEINLTPIVGEAVILAIPYIPVCNEDCKGLCPNCGENLNKTVCECKTEKTDPRLADLAKWFDQNETTE